MWSLGTLFYQMLTRHLPFSEIDREVLNEKIMAGELDLETLLESKPSYRARNLLFGLLNMDPDRRLSAEEALNHPFILEFTSI